VNERDKIKIFIPLADRAFLQLDFINIAVGGWRLAAGGWRLIVRRDPINLIILLLQLRRRAAIHFMLFVVP